MTNDVGLVVIDVQVGNFDESAPVYRGAELLERISSLIGQARAACGLGIVDIGFFPALCFPLRR